MGCILYMGCMWYCTWVLMQPDFCKHKLDNLVLQLLTHTRSTRLSHVLVLETAMCSLQSASLQRCDLAFFSCKAPLKRVVHVHTWATKRLPASSSMPATSSAAACLMGALLSTRSLYTSPTCAKHQ